MSDKTELKDQDGMQGSERDRSVDQSRRRLAKAGLAAPVIMSLASRSALATTERNFCTISGWGSVHPSGRPDDQRCAGRSPGFWGTYWSGPTATAWARTGFDPGPTNPLGSSHDYSIPTYTELNQAVTDDVITAAEKDAYILAIGAASTFDDLMGQPTFLPDNGLDSPKTRPTIMQVFHDHSIGWLPANNTAWHYAASLMNAAAWGDDYGYTLAEMRTLISLRDGEPGFLLDLEGLYDRPGYQTF
ncbi:MAG: hypothetical protein ABW079_01890 [Sedimenticola sp.]